MVSKVLKIRIYTKMFLLLNFSELGGDFIGVTEQLILK
jgi:hypothetical protein